MYITLMQMTVCTMGLSPTQERDFAGILPYSTEECYMASLEFNTTMLIDVRRR